MSKGKKINQDTSAWTNYLNYLKGYDTSNVDNTLSNLTNWASNSSANNLGNMGNYTFGVNGSDDARQRMEAATFNSYMDKMNPQFQRQQSDLATALQNKGLGVGTEAYSRAMGDLQDSQNDAINQAAYNATQQGQNAFSQSLADAVNAGSFGNSAQQSYINQLLSALTGSASGYENQQNIFSTAAGKSAVDYANAKANAKGGWGGALAGALKGGLQGFASTGSPWGGLAGGLAGGYTGYNNNPYA